MSSSKLLSIPLNLTLIITSPSSLNPPKTQSLFSNFTPSLTLHPTHKPKNPFSHKPFKTHHSPLLAAPPNCLAPPPDPQPEQISAAQEAISELLQEYGASEVESAFISLNSPKYLKMLVDGVYELDELGLWKEGFELVGLKEKVVFLAKEKGDNGKVAFLESAIGLSLSSAMNVARQLSKVTLPGLIEKVKYVKEIFFSGSNDGRLIGKNARRMMMHLSIPIDDDLQQTLSFFEKIAARRGGLDMLGSEDATLRYLIESFPSLLFLSLDPHMTPVVEYLEKIGVHREFMRNIFLLFPPIIFCSIKVIKTRLLAFKEVGVEDKDFSRMLIKYPWILSTSIQKNFKEVVSFFDLEKVPKMSVGRAIRSWPHILGCSTSTLKVMVEQIDELGIASKKLGQVISRSPQLLIRKPKEFLEVLSFLEGLGIDKESVGSILGRCPEIFAANIEETLKRKVEFLASIGISDVLLPRVIRMYPELLVSDTDKTLLPRVKYLMEKGLSQKNIVSMLGKFSPILGYSIEEVLRPKIEFLINTMEKPITDVVDYPRYFSYSLEKKIRPRYLVLKGKNIECSLNNMLAKNDEQFSVEFMVNWTKPPRGWWKINCDGAFNRQARNGAWSFVIRDDDGQVVGGAGRFLSSARCAFDTEAIAVKEACQYAIDNGLSPVMIETESKQLVEQAECTDRTGDALVKAVSDLLQLIPSSVLSFIPRGGNCAAHELVKFVYRTKHDCIWSGPLPSNMGLNLPT